MRRLGVGYRKALDDWLNTRPTQVKSLEITAEHFFDSGDEFLTTLSESYPLLVHGLGLSLGTPGPLCKDTLSKFARVAKAANAEWVSEHVAFSRTADVDLGHLNPVPHNEESLKVLVDHALEVSAVCGRPLVLENITSSLKVPGSISETDFLNRLCQQANCGLLLDATNLFINAKNHNYDPFAWFRELEPSSIRQMHVVGYHQRDGVYHDSHSAVIQDDLLELIIAIVEYSDVEAITLERDGRLDETEEIENELNRLHDAFGQIPTS